MATCKNNGIVMATICDNGISMETTCTNALTMENMHYFIQEICNHEVAMAATHFHSNKLHTTTLEHMCFHYLGPLHCCTGKIILCMSISLYHMLNGINSSLFLHILSFCEWLSLYVSISKMIPAQKAWWLKGPGLWLNTIKV